MTGTQLPWARPVGPAQQQWVTSLSVTSPAPPPAHYRETPTWHSCSDSEDTPSRCQRGPSEPRSFPGTWSDELGMSEPGPTSVWGPTPPITCGGLGLKSRHGPVSTPLSTEIRARLLRSAQESPPNRIFGGALESPQSWTPRHSFPGPAGGDVPPPMLLGQVLKGGGSRARTATGQQRLGGHPRLL